MTGAACTKRCLDADDEIIEHFRARAESEGVGYQTLINSLLRKAVVGNGWVLRGVRGSHHVFSHPARGGHIRVPHPKKDLGAGPVEKLLKHAGLK